MNIYDIAEMAGVSVSTVSRVINDKGGIGESTRKRILNLMKEHDFQPKISKSSSDTIGVFINTNLKNPLADPYIIGVIGGIGEAVFNNGYSFMMMQLNRVSKDREGFKAFCLKHKICGVIFLTLSMKDEFVLDYADVVPIVTIGADFKSDRIISVRSKNREGAYEAVNYLLENGHKSIAFFVPDMNFLDHFDRYTGYEEALKSHGIEVDKRFVIEYDYTNYSVTDLGIMIDNLFCSTKSRPTAAFICDDMEALRISSIMTEKGIKIPEDVSIIGFDDYEYSKHFSPPLTTVRQPIYELGKSAAEAVIDSLDNKNAVTDILLDTRLIVRKSVISV